MIFGIKSLILVKTFFVELVLNFIRNFSKVVLRIKGKQFPGQTERVIQISGFVLTLSDELMLELL